MGELFEDLSKVRLEELCISDRLRAWYLLDLEHIGAPVLIMETPEGIILAGDGAPGKERLVCSSKPGYAYNAEWFASDLYPRYLTGHFLGWRDRHDEQEVQKPRTWLVDGLVGKGSLVSVFGPVGCGKSFYALDMAFSVAAGAPFLGEKVEQGPVFYLSDSGRSDTVRRMHAWEIYHGIEVPSRTLFLAKGLVSFMDPEDLVGIKTGLKRIAKTAGTPKMVVIDNLSSHFAGGDTDSGEDMTAFISIVDGLRKEFPEISVVVVHYSGGAADAEKYPGIKTLREAANLELEVEKEGDSMTVTRTKGEPSLVGGAWTYKFKNVELENGAISLVLTPPKTAPKLKPHKCYWYGQEPKPTLSQKERAARSRLIAIHRAFRALYEG